MSARPSRLKSPNSFTTLAWAERDAKVVSPTSPQARLPRPIDQAIRIVVQPETPVRAMSDRPSPSKSPTRRVTPLVADQPGKELMPMLRGSNVWLPFAYAMGTDPHELGPVSAMSVRPSPSKSPASFGVPPEAHSAKFPPLASMTLGLATTNWPSKGIALGKLAHPVPPVRARPVMPILRHVIHASSMRSRCIGVNSLLQESSV
jgi:hypothetical protein